MTDLPFEVWLTPASPVVFEGPLRFADEADWARYLKSWCGVCENIEAPLPVEGVDYRLKGSAS